MSVRQVILDTETTGLFVRKGDRIIEIGCVELLDRKIGNRYQQYLNPEREVGEGAIKIHGIKTSFLQDKPLFKDCMEEFLKFIEGAELLMHNAGFDIEFVNKELKLAGCKQSLADCCSAITDTLQIARSLHPGITNSLDQLCRRYQVDSSGRDRHGALLDAELLAQVYLKMSGGQARLGLARDEDTGIRTGAAPVQIRRQPGETPLRVLRASEEEQAAHIAYLQKVKESAEKGHCLWLEQESA